MDTGTAHNYSYRRMPEPGTSGSPDREDQAADGAGFTWRALSMLSSSGVRKSIEEINKLFQRINFESHNRIPRDEFPIEMEIKTEDDKYMALEYLKGIGRPLAVRRKIRVGLGNGSPLEGSTGSMWCAVLELLENCQS